MMRSRCNSVLLGVTQPLLYCSSVNIHVCIIQLCKHVVAKVTLVPCSVNLKGKWDKVGHGKVTINNARIIGNGQSQDDNNNNNNNNNNSNNNNYNNNNDNLYSYRG